LQLGAISAGCFSEADVISVRVCAWNEVMSLVALPLIESTCEGDWLIEQSR
jgi:hypothetical protein